MLNDIRQCIIPATAETVPDSRDTISQVEAQFGSVPEPYRSLLLEHGPFRFRGFADVVGGEVDDLVVMLCYGAGGQHNIPDLYATSPEVFGERWVPFARDEYGSRYAWQRDDQSIWFFDSERGMTPTKVFPTMQAFLDAIEVDPYDA